MVDIIYKELSYEIQGALFEVNKSLGHAYKESVYHMALQEELRRRNLHFESELKINITYKGMIVGCYKPDFVIEDKVIVEIKAKKFMVPADHQQFMYYLKGSNYRLGYLVNFGKPGKVEYIRKICDYSPPKANQPAT